ncbi:DeoR/GlpR family DNA-binding transcription regulator [uncultured Clostridium sp.]|uniref:DeoR/GlpR family DNA-binding transcription regulator n=1 Tax=uncultured Clostridium sp. TaxID=59620 RepID=UPI00262E62D7|nr:DeoR/GlpR family DNA-binding transcription regulator [uncultured Clostridium sp.]
MITERRHIKILKMLEEFEIIKLSEIIEEINTSESTVRRDLDFLEKKGLLERVHGGAKRVTHKGEELSYSEKSIQNIEDKEKIGKLAAELVEENDGIFIDAGTSTYEMIPYLKGKNIMVITTGVNHIGALIENNIPCYMIGGKVKEKTKAIIGSDAIENLKKFSFDKAFLGANGVHGEFGYTTPDSEEAMIKRIAKELSREVFILADHTKFNKSALVKFGELEEGIILTDIDEGIETIKELTEVRMG